MAKIRPIVRGFGPVAPGGGAVIGAGLQAVGQAVGELADLRTNRELLDIREQAQVDALEFKQFEKMERSEAMAQIIIKQIARNNESSRIIAEDRDVRNFDDTQKKIDAFENDYNQSLFLGKSKEFQDIFLSLDQPRRLGNINKTGTAVEAGRLRVMVDNFQALSRDIIKTVTADIPASQIAEDYRDLRQFAAGLGVKKEFIEAVIERDERAAFEQLIRSVSIIEGLALLSDEDVANGLGDDGRETMRRDLLTRARSLESAQELTNEVDFRISQIDVLNAFRDREDAASIKNRIREAGLSPTQEKDIFDFIDILAVAREKGPQPVDPQIVKANQDRSKGILKNIIDATKAVSDDEDIDPEAKQRELLRLNDKAISIYSEAALMKEQGAFTPAALVGLGFQLDEVTEGLFRVQEVAKSSILDKISFAAAFLLSPALALQLKDKTGVNKDIDLRVSNAIVSSEIGRMNIGEGRYGRLSSADRISMERFIVDESIKTEGAGKLLPTSEAIKMSEDIYSAAEDRLLREIKGLSESAAEKAKELLFNSGEPAMEPIQQPSQLLLTDIIRSGFNQNMTEEAIREQAREFEGFSDEAFDRAVAAVDFATANAPALRR